MILDGAALERRFGAGRRVAAILDTLAMQTGAEPIADYAWEVPTPAGTIRHLRRVTKVGLIALREEGAADGGPDSLSIRAQIVTLQQATDIAMVRYERAGAEPFWELHVGDGNPQPVPEAEIEAGFALVRAALEATIRR